MEVKTHQGASAHTKRKEFEIGGITTMRMKMFKTKFFKYRKILLADVFCGSGINEFCGEIVDGSPIKLLDGFFGAYGAFETKYLFADHYNRQSSFWFSDVRGDACDSLKRLVQAKYGLDIYPQRMFAKDAINHIGELMHKNKDMYLFLILDPNGPKDFPANEIEDMLKIFSKRMDIIPYISATTINRCIQAREKGGMNFGYGYLQYIQDFSSGFVKKIASGGRFGWIRDQIPGDPQRWTLMPTFGCLKPRNNWEKQGYYDMNSPKGQLIIEHYCGGVKNAR